MDMNVVNFEEFKRNAKADRSKATYKNYLRLLETQQLENEIQHLLDSADTNVNLESITSKSEMILSEIASRTSVPTQTAVEELKHDLTKALITE